MVSQNTTIDRNGFALPAAVLSLVVVGVLVTGGFYMARQETRIGMASQQSALSFYLAEAGMNDVLENWDAAAYGSLANFASAQRVDTASHGIWTVDITKVGSAMYLLEASAEAKDGGALRTMAQMVRVRTADIGADAALRTQGAVRYGGNSSLRGNDLVPDGSSRGRVDWTGMEVCDGVALTDKPALLVKDQSLLSFNGNTKKSESNTSGAPKFDEDPSITTESLTSFGDLSWDEMTALADIRLASAPSPGPSLTGSGACNYADSVNWGEPRDTTHPCFNYFPIIHITNVGEADLNGGIGQGILLIDGDAKMNGGFEFYGPVYVRGRFRTHGSGGHVWGGVTAGNVNLDQNTVLGNGAIQFSSCAIQRAVSGAAGLSQPVPISERSWVDASGVGGD